MSHRKFAPTPPMGWNSWDCFAATVTEDQLIENALYMQKHLLIHGWQYIVCDIQWYEPLAGTGEGEYRQFAEPLMDEYGRLFPAKNRFPSTEDGLGFTKIADKIHALGLKFGIHIMRGIPREAVHKRLPILGTDYTADQIASPFSISRWNGDMYGLNPNHPGSQSYYDSIFELYSSWGVDYVKVDDICNTNMYPNAPYSAKGEIELIHNAIMKTGSSIVLSLSPGPAVIEESWHLSEHSNLWRMTDDFWDTWPHLYDMFRRCEIWQRHVGDGCWPDCDMLPLGRIGMGFKQGRNTRFTHDEQITLMTLWCIFRSPLMMGGNMPENDKWTLDLLTNSEVLAVNQHGITPRQISHNEKSAVWTSSSPNGGYYVALFNLSNEQMSVSAELSNFNLESAQVRDLWKCKDCGIVSKTLTQELNPHGAALLHIC